MVFSTDFSSLQFFFNWDGTDVMYCINWDGTAKSAGNT